MWNFPQKSGQSDRVAISRGYCMSIFSNHSHRSRAGFSYVVVLILVAVLSSVALSFINRVGVTSSSTNEHWEQIQAEYLARGAANHAMWGLLHHGTFPPSESVYYVRDLGDGRYAYKTRRHTTTTFATVATMGIVGESVAHASYVIFIPPW